MITDAEDPYLYVRSTTDRRVLAGGEDETFGGGKMRKEVLAEKSAAIQQKLAKMLPNLDVAIDFSWTGAFGMSVTGLPLIGKIPGFPRCYAVMGFGGYDTTFSQIATDLITADITGAPEAVADLFAFEASADLRLNS
jgi:glycine/D-amino acid oxidase-like deaminating enzyme